MRLTKTVVLTLVALIEGAAIVALWFGYIPRLKSITVSRVSVPEPSSPLALALEYESPDSRFEQLVRDHRGWIQYRPRTGGLPVGSLLSECAVLKRTNYVRILIANGADVDEALTWLGKHGLKEEAALIRQVASERK